MDDFQQMHIFFVVATAAVVIFTISVCIFLVYITRLVSTLNSIAKNVQEEAEEIRADLDDARAQIIREGRRLVPLISLFGKTALRLGFHKKKRKS